MEKIYFECVVRSAKWLYLHICKTVWCSS